MIRAVGLVGLVLLAVGCGTPDVRIDEAYHASPPLKVAILPFVGPEGDHDDDTLDRVDYMRRTFYRHFASLPFIHLELDQIDRRLREAGLLTPAAIHAAPAERLGQLLGADALIGGQIDAISNIAPLLAYYRSVGGRVWMKAASEGGEEYLEASYLQWESGGPLIESSQVISGLMNQIANSSNLAFISLVEKWAEKIVERIPHPRNADRGKIAAAQSPPELAAFTLRGSRDGALQPGDRLLAGVDAEPGLRVEVALGLTEQLSLFEVSPGRYEGTYLVQVGDSVAADHVTAIATSMYGQRARKVLEMRLVVDARPPSAPKALRAERETGRVQLRWTSGAEGAPAQGYAVYRAPAAEPARFTRIGRSDRTAYTDTTAEAETAYRYQVVALGGPRLHSFPSSHVESAP